MRIRKHAKISPLLYTTSSHNPGTLIQTHICQLNQSPWDVMDFSPPSSPLLPPPPPSQVIGNDGYAGIGSCSQESIPVGGGDYLNDAMKWEYSDGIPGGATPIKAEQASDDLGTKESQEPTINYCCKTDGKSWQCRREAAKGNSLCEHHLSMVRSYSNSAHSSTKHLAKSGPDSRRRTRPKKQSTDSSSSNPYVFYYYSGFGPRWGKRRGEASKNNASGGACSSPGVDMTTNLEHECDMEASTLCEIDDEYEEDEESDYAEEDEYEVEKEKEKEKEKKGGKKRGRKPIKARSLKSLM